MGQAHAALRKRVLILSSYFPNSSSVVKSNFPTPSHLRTVPQPALYKTIFPPNHFSIQGNVGGKIDISLRPRFVLTFTLTDSRYVAYILWKGSGRSGFAASQVLPT